MCFHLFVGRRHYIAVSEMAEYVKRIEILGKADCRSFLKQMVIFIVGSLPPWMGQGLAVEFRFRFMGLTHTEN